MVGPVVAGPKEAEAGMPRKRMLDPLIWDDPDFAELSRDARLLFIGLISLADDYGHVPGRPATLRKMVFGYDDLSVADVATLLDEIVGRCRNVHPYEVDGQQYLWLKTWERHQDLRFRAKAQYPCHVCGQYHTADDYGSCTASGKDCATPTQETAPTCAIYTQDLRKTIAQPLPPREEKRVESCSVNNTYVAPPAPIAPVEVPKPERVMFSSLCQACGYDPKRLTRSERGELNEATKQLLSAKYGPGDVAAMAANWFGHFEDCSMTPSALAKHASRLMHAAEREPPGYGRRQTGSGPALKRVDEVGR